MIFRITTNAKHRGAILTLVTNRFKNFFVWDGSVYAGAIKQYAMCIEIDTHEISTSAIQALARAINKLAGGYTSVGISSSKALELIEKPEVPVAEHMPCTPNESDPEKALASRRTLDVFAKQPGEPEESSDSEDGVCSPGDGYIENPCDPPEGAPDEESSGDNSVE